MKTILFALGIAAAPAATPAVEQQAQQHQTRRHDVRQTARQHDGDDRTRQHDTDDPTHHHGANRPARQHNTSHHATDTARQHGADHPADQHEADHDAVHPAEQHDAHALARHVDPDGPAARARSPEAAARTGTQSNGHDANHKTRDYGVERKSVSPAPTVKK